MRIAIVRLSSLGDVVHTLPVAAAIRASRPDAFIAWIVEEHEQTLLERNPAVDQTIVAPLRRWKELLVRGRVGTVLRDVRALAHALRSSAFDVAIDAQGWTHKTSPIVALTGASVRIGFSRSYARDSWSPRFTNRHVTPEPTAAHIVDQNLALLQPLGIDARTAAFPFPSWPDASEHVDVWLAGHHVRVAPLVVLLPSTRGPRKLWPASSYATLARRLADRTGAEVVLAGGPGDRPIFDAVTSASHGLQVYAPEAIGDLANLLGRASLVIGNDTGPLHLAAAAMVPTIGLFGPTSGRRNGPYGAAGRFIQSSSGHMADITIDQVLETAMHCLECVA
jgi:heptosyltransferase-1